MKLPLIVARRRRAAVDPRVPLEFTAGDTPTYQQDIIVHAGTGSVTSDAQGWHVYPGCDPDKVIFTDEAETPLTCYLWPGTYTAEARYTVLIPEADSDGTIMVVPDEEPTSDGPGTFLLFDHFEGSAEDAPDPTLWTTHRLGTEVGTIQQDGSGNLVLTAEPDAPNSVSIRSITTFDRGIGIEWREKVSAPVYCDTAFGKGDVAPTTEEEGAYWHTGLIGGYVINVQDGSGFGSDGSTWEIKKSWPDIPGSDHIFGSTAAIYPANNTAYTIRYELLPETITVYRDGTTIATGTDAEYFGTGFRIGFHQGQYYGSPGGTRTIEYVLARVATTSPPTLVAV